MNASGSFSELTPRVTRYARTALEHGDLDGVARDKFAPDSLNAVVGGNQPQFDVSSVISVS